VETDKKVGLYEKTDRILKLCKETNGMMEHVRRLIKCKMTDRMMGCAKRLKK